jgi:alpha-glucosidase
VVYFSPLFCLCDSLANYRGQPGVELLCDLLTVWNKMVVLSAKVAEHVVLARQSAENWRLAATNNTEPLVLETLLTFLGDGERTIHASADTAESSDSPQAISESTASVDASTILDFSLASSGGYAAVLTPQKLNDEGAPARSPPDQHRLLTSDLASFTDLVTHTL